MCSGFTGFALTQCGEPQLHWEKVELQKARVAGEAQHATDEKEQIPVDEFQKLHGPRFIVVRMRREKCPRT
jgi:hypothetical protein